MNEKPKRLLHVTALRLLPLEHGQGIGVEVLTTEGEQMMLTMSGEGLTAFGKAIRTFLRAHPNAARSKGPQRH